MLLVTGGYYETFHPNTYHYLDSTETFDPLVGSWTTSGARLPHPTEYVKAVTLDNRVLLFGIIN